MALASRFKAMTLLFHLRNIPVRHLYPYLQAQGLSEMQISDFIFYISMNENCDQLITPEFIRIKDQLARELRLELRERLACCNLTELKGRRRRKEI